MNDTMPTCRGCGAESSDLPGRGPYTRLCADCRSAAAKRRAENRTLATSDDIGDELRARTRQPTLTASAQKLVPLAKSLERSLVVRKDAQRNARVELAKFNAQLQELSRVARSLLSTSREEPES